MQQKCPELSVKIINTSDIGKEKDIDPNNITKYSVNFFETDGLLCLMYQNKCISSIEIDISQYRLSMGEMTINSKTAEEYQGKKYNKLLRLIVVVIAPYFNKKVTKLASTVINVISGHLLISLFELSYKNIGRNIQYSGGNSKKIRGKISAFETKYAQLYMENIDEYVKLLYSELLPELKAFTNNQESYISLHIKFNIDEGIVLMAERKIDELLTSEDDLKVIKCI